MKRTFEFRVGAALKCTLDDDRVILNHIDVMHAVYLPNANWQDSKGHYTETGVDMLLFGFGAALVGVIHTAESHSGMNAAKLLRQSIVVMEQLFIRQATSVVHKAKLSVPENARRFSRMEQTLVEFMGDFLDSEIVELEQAQAGMKDPLPRQDTELHVRMAKAAMAEYRRTVVAV